MSWQNLENRNSKSNYTVSALIFEEYFILLLPTKIHPNFVKIVALPRNAHKQFEFNNFDNVLQNIFVFPIKSMWRELQEVH